MKSKCTCGRPRTPSLYQHDGSCDRWRDDEEAKLDINTFARATIDAGLAAMTPPEEARWRTIFTDTESRSGVAPVCPIPETHTMMHTLNGECCAKAGPRLECGTEEAARLVVRLLNNLGVEVCS